MTRAMHLDRITLFRRHAPQPAMIEAR
jgi:hypothetical protein